MWVIRLTTYRKIPRRPNWTAPPALQPFVVKAGRMPGRAGLTFARDRDHTEPVARGARAGSASPGRYAPESPNNQTVPAESAAIARMIFIPTTEKCLRPAAGESCRYIQQGAVGANPPQETLRPPYRRGEATLESSRAGTGSPTVQAEDHVRKSLRSNTERGGTESLWQSDAT